MYDTNVGRRVQRCTLLAHSLAGRALRQRRASSLVGVATAVAACSNSVAAAAPSQVASRKVKQLIVLVDKMEQAQSALELKLRGTEERPPARLCCLFVDTRQGDSATFLR
jgi:hypothetical protein